MPFNIPFNWNLSDETRSEHVEQLAEALRHEFPWLDIRDIDRAALAQQLGLDEDGFPGLEFTDSSGELLGAIISIGVHNVTVSLPSEPGRPINSALDIVRPLFDALSRAGLRVVDGFEIVTEYEEQRRRVHQAAKMLGGVVNTARGVPPRKT